MGGAVKLGAVIGGAYAIGSWGGAWVAGKANVTTPGVVTGIKIGTGIVAYVALMSVLR